ncbi:MAG: trpA [Spartobacteria bacterium]|nr:trpA [Spartobacteria bacterium]
MPNRIDQCFAKLRSEKQKGFIPYICAGDPDLDGTIRLSLALETAGADVLELGLPFSDPLADGPVNQLASQRALAAGATVPAVLSCVRAIRKESQIPIVLYTYLNPIFQFGLKKFHEEAATAGVDGLLILDLPPEEDVDFAGDQIVHVRLIAPTTPPERIAEIAGTAQGFIYYVSREGVTGAQKSVVSSLESGVRQIRQFSGLPIAVGFGISTPEQARTVAQHADAVVIGSAIVSEVAKFGRDKDFVQRVIETVEPLVEAIRSVSV